MSEKKSTLSRRQFIQGAAGIGLVAATGITLRAEATEEVKRKTRVVLIRDSAVFDNQGKLDPEVIARMLDESVARLFDKKTATEVWPQLCRPDDLVGIKSNVWQYLRTPPEVEAILKERVMQVGVPEKNIAIGDRGILENEIFQKATKLINVRPLRTHHWSGVGGCIKNYIQFVPTPADYHDEYCSPLGSIWKMPLVKDKTPLNILLVLQPLFYGIGPHHYDRSYTWNYCGLFVSTDPVAVDAVGVQLFEAKRREFFKEDRPLTPPALHVRRAETVHGIGVSDLEKIELVKLGWNEGILI